VVLPPPDSVVYEPGVANPDAPGSVAALVRALNATVPKSPPRRDLPRTPPRTPPSASPAVGSSSRTTSKTVAQSDPEGWWVWRGEGSGALRPQEIDGSEIHDVDHDVANHYIYDDQGWWFAKDELAEDEHAEDKHVGNESH
jgi:hypothetical protein